MCGLKNHGWSDGLECVGQFDRIVQIGKTQTVWMDLHGLDKLNRGCMGLGRLDGLGQGRQVCTDWTGLHSWMGLDGLGLVGMR